MKTTQFFQVGKNNIVYVGDQFKQLFGDTEFTIPKKLKLEHRVLEKSMLDKEILEQWKPKESTLGELAWTIKNWEKAGMLRNSYANIFYIHDKQNTLWAVSALWDSSYGGWDVSVDSVASLSEWRAGRRVFSQAFSELDNLISGNLEDRIKSLEKDMEKIRKLINL